MTRVLQTEPKTCMEALFLIKYFVIMNQVFDRMNQVIDKMNQGIDRMNQVINLMNQVLQKSHKHILVYLCESINIIIE